MMVALGGTDYITFSGGIGENGLEERERRQKRVQKNVVSTIQEFICL